MNEVLGQLDADLKGFFVENQLKDMNELLQEQPDAVIRELSEYNWKVIKKYYDDERFNLLFQHFKFVAYTCYIVEYAHKLSFVNEEEFECRMKVYHDIYELKRQQES